MKNMINLETERMKGFGSYPVGNFNVNYLHGLNDLCEQFVTNDFEILELGCNNGVSTFLFSNFAKKIVSVDMVKTSEMTELIEKSDNINFNHMSFNEFLLNDGDKKYDLIYIDGGHSYEDVYEDIKNYKHKVKINGYISGHDFNNLTPGVEKAVKSHFPNEKVYIFSDSSWLIKL